MKVDRPTLRRQLLQFGGIFVLAAILPLATHGAQTNSLAGSSRLGWWHEAKFGMFIHWGL